MKHVPFRELPVGAIFTGMLFRASGEYLKVSDSEFRPFGTTDRGIIQANPEEMNFSVRYRKTSRYLLEKTQA